MIHVSECTGWFGTATAEAFAAGSDLAIFDGDKNVDTVQGAALPFHPISVSRHRLMRLKVIPVRSGVACVARYDPEPIVH
jgi:hypothetical protein